ncbi:MAG: tetratricopeptide repeat protein, partial [Oscillospiraceae bacterium]|nr:tetratricopeptide repeat protein [Oscillospiraceae bacterium]
MSFRKADVVSAQKLMREIHNLTGFESISIWYDRFLIAGQDFNNAIFKEIEQSKAFLMVITPNIVAKCKDGTDNFIVIKEYLYACENNIPIIALYESDCDYNLDDLRAVFKGIPNPIDIKQAEPYLRSLFPNLPSIDSYTSERLYYLGQAYFSGYYVEQDVERAVSIFKKAAAYEDEYALKSSEMLAELYNSGDLVGGINYAEALKWRLITVQICENLFGKNHPDMAISYNNIGSVYLYIAHYQKALKYFFKSLEIREKILGKEHPDTAMSYDNIGTIYNYKGEYEIALEYWFKALEIREKVVGKDHPNTATSYNNIGLIYNNKGKYDKALEYYEKALKIREKVLGKEHSDMAISYNNIGAVYNHKGDYEKALEYYLKALEIREKILGKDHPDTAVSYNNIGLVYSQKGHYENALRYYFKALEIREKILGKDHPDTAISYNNIGAVYNHKGDYEKTLEYYLKALKIYEKFLGIEHPYTIAIYSDIYFAYNSKGDHKKAQVYFFKDLIIYEKLLGKDVIELIEKFTKSENILKAPATDTYATRNCIDDFMQEVRNQHYDKKKTADLLKNILNFFGNKAIELGLEELGLKILTSIENSNERIIELEPVDIEYFNEII